MPIASQNTTLLLHFNGNNNDTVTTDEIASNRKFNFAGVTKISTEQAKFGNSSLYIGGTGINHPDYLYYLGVYGKQDMDMRGEDFSISCWIYRQSTGIHEAEFIMSGSDGYVTGTCFEMLIGGNEYPNEYTGKITCSLLTGTDNYGNYENELFYCNGQTVIPNDVWTHVAYTRQGNQLRLYVNGVLDGTKTLPDNLVANNNGMPYFIIGTRDYNPKFSWQGHIDEVYIVRGESLWTSNFTPPTEPYTYTAPADVIVDANTKLLLHGDNSTIDSATSKTITSNGLITYENGKFGSAIKFDGTTSYLTTPYHADLELGTTDFTIDFWAKFDAISSNDMFINTYYLGDGYYYRLNSSQQLEFGYYSGTALELMINQDSDTNWSTGTWYHIAVVRKGNDIALYKDGVVVGHKNQLVDLQISEVNPISIGALYQFAIGAEQFHNGVLDEFRVSNVARWTHSFNPQNTPYGATSIIGKRFFIPCSPHAIDPQPSVYGNTGGEITFDGEFAIHKFTSVGSTPFMACKDGVAAEVLLVGGGGGGGGTGAAGGGGGGGGISYFTEIPIATGETTVIVGDGGEGGWGGIDFEIHQGQNESDGNNGLSSSFGAYIISGGGGGRGTVEYDSGKSNDACGGGGGSSFANPGIANLGQNGGYGLVWDGVRCAGGGGGGWLGAGEDGALGQSGRGGNGLQLEFHGQTYNLSGGGGAGGYPDFATPLLAGIGVDGGGNGGYGSGINGQDGTPNTGGGGGGCSCGVDGNNSVGAGGKGGSGLVMIVCRVSEFLV